MWRYGNFTSSSGNGETNVSLCPRATSVSNNGLKPKKWLLPSVGKNAKILDGFSEGCSCSPGDSFAHINWKEKTFLNFGRTAFLWDPCAHDFEKYNRRKRLHRVRRPKRVVTVSDRPKLLFTRMTTTDDGQLKVMFAHGDLRTIA